MRGFNKLSARKVAAITKEGRYSDGLNLYLEVTGGGVKSWIYRYMLNGISRDMGLGPVHSVSLAAARERAKEVRMTLMAGRDPLEERRAAQAALQAKQASTMSFAECAHAYLTEHLDGFKNAKHRQQWQAHIDKANHTFGAVNVAVIDTPIVVKFLQPVWSKTPETGSRLRGRIEKVLSWAAARGLRDGPNPARWKEHLEHLLAKRPKSDHHSAMPVEELPAFMATLRSLDSISARALELTVLTASRTSEVIEAKWNEVDMKNATFTIPAERMKAGVEHTVPLSARALAILRDLPRAGDYLFPGVKDGKPLSNMAMLELLRGVAGNGYTVHGFRSTFRDWAGEQTNFPREVVEHALAHKLPDKVEAAYWRKTALPKRVKLMDAWSKFCERPVGANNVVDINKAS